MYVMPVPNFQKGTFSCPSFVNTTVLAAFNRNPGFLQCGCVRNEMLFLAKLMWNRGGQGDIEVTSTFLGFVGCSLLFIVFEIVGLQIGSAK